jgi:hypothetical protein
MVVSTQVLNDFVRNAKRGESCIYHTGNLMSDRLSGDWPYAAAVADLAWELQEAGKINLTQKRIGEGEFDYRATRTSVR